MIFPQTMDNSIDDELVIGGDGDSPETAVKFRPCSLSARIARERRFICERFGTQSVDWEEEFHLTSLDRQSVWMIRLSDGSKRNVYFDTSQTIYEK
jgi:hypothetical protein